MIRPACAVDLTLGRHQVSGQASSSTARQVPRDNPRSMPTTTGVACSPFSLRITSTGTLRHTAPGIQSGLSPARASSATRIAMQRPPDISNLQLSLAQSMGFTPKPAQFSVKINSLGERAGRQKFAPLISPPRE